VSRLSSVDQSARFAKKSFVLPRPFELAILGEIGNMLLALNRVEEYRQWMRQALLEAAGLPAWQQAIAAAMAQEGRLDWRQLLDHLDHKVSGITSA
jgi:hypothetical protein